MNQKSGTGAAGVAAAAVALGVLLSPLPVAVGVVLAGVLILVAGNQPIAGLVVALSGGVVLAVTGLTDTEAMRAEVLSGLVHGRLARAWHEHRSAWLQASAAPGAVLGGLLAFVRAWVGRGDRGRVARRSNRAGTATAAGWLGRARAPLGARSGARRPGGRGLVLGRDERGRPVELTDEQLGAHALIAGATGSGKTVTLTTILCQAVARGMPVVLVDLKGDPGLAARLERAAAAAGRRFHGWSLSGPCSWNPLARGDASELKDKLIGLEAWSEPHYKRAAERYLQLLLTTHHHHGQVPTLARVVDGLDPAELDRLLRGTPPEFAQRVRRYLDGLTGDQRSAISGLQSRLAVITESTVGRYLEPAGADTTIDLATSLDRGEVVVFSLNSGSHGELAAQIAGLVLQDLKTVAGHRLTGPDRPLGLVAVDEFSALQGDHVHGLFARARQSRLGVILATQELTDLDRAAAGLREQVLGNTNVKIIHRQDTPESAQTIADVIGTRQTWQHTHQTTGLLTSHGRRTGQGTRRLVDEYIVHPNRLKTLPIGHAAVVVKAPEQWAGVMRVARGPSPG